MPWRIALLGVTAALAAGSARADSIWPVTGFGQGGVAVVQEGGNPDYPNAVVVEPDGSIVVAGSPEDQAAHLFRVTADGRSVGFGSAHLPLRIPTGVTCSPGLATKHDGTIVLACGETIATLAPSGRLLASVSIAGATLDAVAFDSHRRTLAAGNELVRLLPDGSLDHGFGTDGRIPLPAQATSIAIADGHVLVVANGSIEDVGAGSTFAGPAGFIAGALAVDGAHVVAGGSIGTDAALVSFSVDGSVDTTYGDHGIATWFATPAESEQVVALGLRPNGAVDAAIVVDLPDDPDAFVPPQDWLVQRVMPTGELGPAARGPDYFDPTTGCLEQTPVAIAEQPNGKPVVAGAACFDGGEGDEYSLLVRYTASLALDEGSPLRLRALGPPAFRGRTIAIRVSVNGPCRIVAQIGHLRATTIDVAHAGPVTVHVWAGTHRPHEIDVRAYDARGYFTEVAVKPTGQATPVPPSPQ